MFDNIRILLDHEFLMLISCVLFFILFFEPYSLIDIGDRIGEYCR